MIKLYQYPPLWNLPNVSPFCMKLETYLRMVSVPYENVYLFDPRKSPTGKLPFIKDDGIVIADSSLIIDYLKQKNNDMDLGLTPLQQAQGLAVQRMLEEHLYWALLYSRWVDPSNWPITRDAFFGHLRGISRVMLPNLIHRKMLKQIKTHVGGYNADVVYKLGVKDLEAVSTILKGNLFLMGDKLSSFDATTYAFLANVIVPPTQSPLKTYATSQQHLVEYCERMENIFKKLPN